jgi:hypothetical protein
MLSIGFIPRPVRGLVGNLRLNACARHELLVHPTKTGCPDFGAMRSLQNVQISA